jgi:uncharacterized membrane protein YhhN
VSIPRYRIRIGCSIIFVSVVFASVIYIYYLVTGKFTSFLNPMTALAVAGVGALALRLLWPEIFRR